MEVELAVTVSVCKPPQATNLCLASDIMQGLREPERDKTGVEEQDTMELL